MRYPYRPFPAVDPNPNKLPQKYWKWRIFSYERVGVISEFNIGGFFVYMRVDRTRKITIKWGK